VNTGAWLAFRPAGGRFGSEIELPAGHAEVTAVLVVGNQVGTTLVAWSTFSGSYLAWARPDGGISAPHFDTKGVATAIWVEVSSTNGDVVVNARQIAPDTGIVEVSPSLGA
jgi:hypothetical protein